MHQSWTKSRGCKQHKKTQTPRPWSTDEIFYLLNIEHLVSHKMKDLQPQDNIQPPDAPDHLTTYWIQH